MNVGPNEKRREDALKNALIQIFYTDTIGSCHVENAVEFLRPIPNEKIGQILRLVRLISGSVSDLLAFSFMENCSKALEYLDLDQMEEWVTKALSIYEAQGLHPATEFLSRPHETALSFGNSKRVATLEDVAGKLSILASGLTERTIRFEPSNTPFTDGETVYLPRTFSRFRNLEENLLFLKISAIHKISQIRFNSFLAPKDILIKLFPELDELKSEVDRPGIVHLLNILSERFKKTDILNLYSLIETIRIEKRLEEDFNGLKRDLFSFKNNLLKSIGPENSLMGNDAISQIGRFILMNYDPKFLPKDKSLRGYVKRLLKRNSTNIDSLNTLKFLLKNQNVINTLPLKGPFFYVGTINLSKLEIKILERRKKLEKKFVEILGALIVKNQCKGPLKKELEKASKDLKNTPSITDDIDSALAMVFQKGHCKDKKDSFLNCEHIILHENQDLLEKLKGVGREIMEDLGKIPSSYVSSTLDLATGYYDPTLLLDSKKEEAPSFLFFSYPEWDFRRGDYRENWCTVKEMHSNRASGNFIETTLRKYKGQVETLRRQFELMRQDFMCEKRQKDGQEIDIDAYVEAYTDLKARLSPTERLYYRLKQDRRDIAVLFLVDMSASTEGWVNQAIKESLVLLTHAIELVGDQYGIYGFSGMRRTGCQYFIIKDFNEGLTNTVKERIIGITSRDYTRMGPAIRHSTNKLKEVEARIKILLVLSDGKPEDYDEYKGPYAIEDTRMALFEARQYGVKPFCITIDKEARSYLPRLYGAANYIFVPDVRLLHKRVPEIYRVLTT